MLKDPEVQLVYIATPHSHHYKCAKMCLEAGKHVLCEKAFTVNAKQAKEILKLAEEKKLLLTEAIWTRYMPSRNMINKLIADGTIGEVTSLTAMAYAFTSFIFVIVSAILFAIEPAPMIAIFNIICPHSRRVGRTAAVSRNSRKQAVRTPALPEEK